jgi:ribonuclease E
MKDALKNDRARIQVGRISSFGLMEMSRQRLRTGVLEASTKPCPHCDGTGLMRTASSAGLSALRMIEDEAARGRGEKILLRAGREAAVYVLNKKRSELADIEHRYGVSIEVVIDESFEGARMTVESSGPRPTAAPRVETPAVDEDDELEIIDDFADEDDVEDEEDETVEISLAGEDRRGQRDEPRDEDDRPGRRRRRRRRGGRGRSRREGGEGEGGEPGEGSESEDIAALAAVDGEIAPAAEAPAEGTGEAAPPAKRSRRRGGRKPAPSLSEAPEPDSSPMIETPINEEPAIAQTAAADEPKPKARRSRAKKADVAVTEPARAEAPPAETAESAAEEAPAKPKRSRSKRAAPTPDSEPAVPAAANADDDDGELNESGEPRRGGWWQRTFG